MMTLDEAIRHCEEKSCGNTECANEHRQLSEWLKELKELRFQKEQMMKDVIQVPVIATGIRADSKGVTTYADIEIPTKERLYPRRDKVKVIIIKE